MTLRNRLGAAMFVVAAIGTLALTGCAASAPKVASLEQAGPAKTAGPAANDDIAKLQQCFHDNGVDITVSERGIEVPDDVSQEAGMKALNACQQFMGAGTGNRGFNDMPEDLKAQVLQVAKCVRAAGYPDWPDPGNEDEVMKSNPHEWPGFDEAYAKCQKEAGLVTMGSTSG